MSITAKRCAEFIEKEFNLTDLIIVYNKNPRFPFNEGWAMDKAYEVIERLLDSKIFEDSETYDFTIGLVKLDTNSGLGEKHANEMG